MTERELGLKQGSKAPDFDLPTETGEMIRLSSLYGGKPILVYFYPSDFGVMCSVVMKAFREIYSELKDHCLFVPISCNTTYSHGAWSDSLRLPFFLLSDVDCSVTKAYDLYGDDNGFLGDRSYRACFMLDKNGIVRYAWAPNDPALEPDYDLLIELAERLDREG
ncbi:MAG: putative peroxiredoxin [Methanomassiliicoccales archaeon PtaU1.Bin124]|nr:MAG: putative peroxiredoxin [Methanomassiliicoccales archaeon PtaU1.Bin124]